MTVPGEGTEWLQEEKEPILLTDSELFESSRFCGTNGTRQCTAWPTRLLPLRGQGLVNLLPSSQSPLSSSESAPAAPRKVIRGTLGPPQRTHRTDSTPSQSQSQRNLGLQEPQAWNPQSLETPPKVRVAQECSKQYCLVRAEDPLQEQRKTDRHTHTLSWR